MSDFTATVAALRARLQTFAALPLYWPNDDRAPTPDAAPAGFVYSEIRVHDESQISLGIAGARTHRDFGELEILIYVPRGSRIGAAEAYAEQIRGLFGTTSVDGVVVTRRTIGVGQNVEASGGRMYAVPVVVEWHADRLE